MDSESDRRIILPINIGMPMTLFEQAAELEKQNKTFALVTITASRGATPRRRGKMIVLPDGEIIGTIGGGPAEREVTQKALQCLKTEEITTLSYNLANIRCVESTGTDSGGNMEFLIEPVLSKPSLFLAGGGHIGLAISKLADFLHYPYVIGEHQR